MDEYIENLYRETACEIFALADKYGMPDIPENVSSRLDTFNKITDHAVADVVAKKLIDKMFISCLAAVSTKRAKGSLEETPDKLIEAANSADNLSKSLMRRRDKDGAETQAKRAEALRSKARELAERHEKAKPQNHQR